ncbi:Snapin/Pallidin-domain-containing protein [Dissophora ornata]|nr:hypothetical protein BGZ58_009910 [Dissophora ornata]KAI8606686.1 Snapin/Pallidin-domain-containing protein [Dissophora ornata]
MSFFKKDYSAYPQPVIVTPDPQHADESISDAVAEAIDTQQSSSPRTGAGTSISQTMEDTQPDRSSQGNTEQGSQQHQSQHLHHQHSQQLHQQQKDNTARLADGIMSLLGPIVQEMDFNIVSVRKSQSELEKEIERLMAELQLFMESSVAPPEVEPAVQKLVKARRQIMSANSTLKAVQDRVDKMHLQIEKRH